MLWTGGPAVISEGLCPRPGWCPAASVAPERAHTHGNPASWLCLTP